MPPDTKTELERLVARVEEAVNNGFLDAKLEIVRLNRQVDAESPSGGGQQSQSEGESRAVRIGDPSQ